MGRGWGRFRLKVVSLTCRKQVRCHRCRPLLEVVLWASLASEADDVVAPYTTTNNTAVLADRLSIGTRKWDGGGVMKPNSRRHCNTPIYFRVT